MFSCILVYSDYWRHREWAQSHQYECMLIRPFEMGQPKEKNDDEAINKHHDDVLAMPMWWAQKSTRRVFNSTLEKYVTLVVALPMLAYISFPSSSSIIIIIIIRTDCKQKHGILCDNSRDGWTFPNILALACHSFIPKWCNSEVILANDCRQNRYACRIDLAGFSSRK